jgi:hypothetical protein
MKTHERAKSMNFDSSSMRRCWASRRQHDQIYRWQVGDLASRLNLAPGPDAMAQVDVLAFVEEGGIGQNRQSAEPDQRGGVTDEINIALTEICCPTAG